MAELQKVVSLFDLATVGTYTNEQCKRKWAVMKQLNKPSEQPPLEAT